MRIQNAIESALGRPESVAGAEHNYPCPFCRKSHLHINYAKGKALCLSGTQSIITDAGVIPVYGVSTAMKRNPHLRALSYNWGAGRTEWRRIVKFYSNGPQSEEGFLRIGTESSARTGAIVTPDHPMCLYTGDLVPASSLRVGDELAAYDYVLSPFQRSVLYGTLLGDAGLSRTTLSMEHGDDQEYYVRWKAGVFPQSTVRRRVQKDSWGERVSWQASVSGAVTEFRRARALFYPSGKKEVPQEALDALGTLGLAVWFMDDGSFSKKHRVATLCCQGFSHPSQQRIANYLSGRGLRFSVCEGVFKFGNEAYKELLSLFSPFLLNDPHRFPGKEKEQTKRWRFFDKAPGGTGMLPSRVVSISCDHRVYTGTRREGGKEYVYPAYRSRRYCIEVEKTHNFFTGGRILVGNCHGCGWRTKYLVNVLRVLGQATTGLGAYSRPIGTSGFSSDIAGRLFTNEDTPESASALPEGFRLIPLGAKRSFMGRIMRNYLVKMRGITEDQIDACGLGYCEEGRYKGCVIFPCYLGGKLIYFTSRRVMTEGPKSLNPRAPRRGAVFNLDRCWGAEELLVVEGPISSLKAEQAGFSCCAVLGHYIPDLVCRIIGRMPRLRIVRVAFDPDVLEKDCVTAARKIASETSADVYYTKLEGGDPADLPPQAFREQIESAIPFGFGQIIREGLWASSK